jgi:hypothetical protein
MLKITWYILPFILFKCILYHKASRHTASNVFWGQSNRFINNELNSKKYRPITIVSCFGKLFTAVLNARLSEFSDEILLINENQCRFRSGYSTTDWMFVLHYFFEISKNKKRKLFCVFVDFEKKPIWCCMARCFMV